MSEESNLIRRENSKLLRALLFRERKAIKAEMVKETGLSVVTINSLVKELVQENILLENASVQQKTGRPAAEYIFNYDKSYYLLISIQEKKSHERKRRLEIIVKIVNLGGVEIVSEVLEFSNNMEDLLGVIEKYIHREYEIERIGLALPGKIFEGVITSSWGSVFDCWNIEEELKKITDIPIKIQNDAHIMTMGFCAEHNLTDGSVVGIFYPEKSMPGVTILSNGVLIEGQKGLAGETKYLPMLMDKAAPDTDIELASNLSEIVAIYNAVIAPDIFVISSENIDEKIIRKQIETNTYLSRQPNNPVIYFDRNFQQSMTAGLRWLVTKDSIYNI
ncbi:ROK family protein [Oceanobacillus sojae]|uniref:ROK family protein n=1 Tax=Oceanobacillus sojae TaxID=582851 RepID=UPI0009884E37|nr:ROK family protein [Oceanobacillus sojae]